jgi:hypothetical protein
VSRKIFIGDQEFIDTDDNSFCEEGRTKPADPLRSNHADFDAFLEDLDSWKLDERIRRMEAEENLRDTHDILDEWED